MIWSVRDHYILQCPACESIYHQTDYVFSEDYDQGVNGLNGEEYFEYNHKIEHWPSPIKRDRPNWLYGIRAGDLDAYDLLTEVYSALDADLPVLAGIGVRTVFDRASQLLGIDPAKSFNEKLADLLAAGYIGISEQEHLAVLSDAGSAAAHRGWRPSANELDTMMTILEAFLHRCFVMPAQARQLRSAVPERPRRLPKPSAPVTSEKEPKKP